MTLHEATEIPARSQKGGPVTGEAYSFVFGGSVLPSGVYDVRHRRLGSFVLYVGPVDRGLLGPAHQAVVNRQRVGS